MAAKASDIHQVSHMSHISAKRSVKVLTASYTITEDDCGAVIFIGADSLVVTLPKVATVGPGFWFTVVNWGADGAYIITLSPNAADGIEGEIANAGQDSHPGGVNDKDIVNTKATAIKGDRVTLVADGTGDWFVLEGVGIWAAEG